MQDTERPHGAPMQRPDATTEVIPISGLAHIGIRVHDLERAVRFYELLGFTKTAGPLGPEPVAILNHPCGLELNLILNAPSASAPRLPRGACGRVPVAMAAVVMRSLSGAEPRAADPKFARMGCGKRLRASESGH